mmetsp:Transcript_2630/g.6164  ORF Transcript_2630/g.6164 Transcript_2630/m.6164 type:complete len:227 (-) Transcript_2630:757-1437(-)
MAAATASSGSSAGIKRQATGRCSFVTPSLAPGCFLPEPWLATMATPFSAKALGSGCAQLCLISCVSCCGVRPVNFTQSKKPSSCLLPFFARASSTTDFPGKRSVGWMCTPVKMPQARLEYRIGHSSVSVRTWTRQSASCSASRIRSPRSGPAAKSLLEGMVAQSSSSVPSMSPCAINWLPSISCTAIWPKFTRIWACKALMERGTRSMAQRAPKRMPSEVTNGQPA